jgi:hypothetical protein
MDEQPVKRKRGRPPLPPELKKRPNQADASPELTPFKRGPGKPRKQKPEEKKSDPVQTTQETGTPLSRSQVTDIVERKQKEIYKKYNISQVDPGDNSRYLAAVRASIDLPPVDLDDPDAVRQRINEYFDFCIANDRKPTMVGMANWLRVSRQTLNNWKLGVYRESTNKPIVEEYIMLLEELWQDYMMNGKVNPASGIFLGKNMFGYKDVQDVVVTPQNPLGEEANEDELRKRIESSVVIDVDDMNET